MNRAEYYKKWASDNPEKCREYRRRWHEKNKESISQKRKEIYRKAHPKLGIIIEHNIMISLK
jgi:hypothetical protein